jgi:SAM-dependent methyltransferase
MNCPACGSGQQHITLLRKNQYTLLCCSNCGLRFSDPMKAGSQVWYEQSPLYTVRRPNKIKYWASAQALKLPAQSVFDVGCGTGEFLYWAKQSGRRVGGCDFNRHNIEGARSVLGLSGLYVGDVNQLDSLEQFDLVTMFEVLEHLGEPVEVLRSLRGMIRPGGFLAVSVPCYERWPRLFDEEADYPPHHLTLWTPAALKACFERAGFEVDQIQRKPLQVTDIGGHLKWRLRRLLRPGLSQHKGKNGAAVSSVLTRGNGVFAALLAPVCWTMRLYSGAGSFTLFGVARPRS